MRLVHDRLRQALERRPTPADALRHLDGIGAVMESRFRYEERELLPLLEGLDGLAPAAVLGPLAPG